MTLGPDDLPEDPFGDGGLAQLICVCLGDKFYYVFSETTVKAICPNPGCQRVMGEWPRVDAKPAPIQPAAPLPPGEQAALREQWTREGQRDMLSAGWLGETPDMPVTFDPGLGAGPARCPNCQRVPGMPTAPCPQCPDSKVPPLPRFSAGICNVYLSGGDYDGQITNMIPGSGDFTVAGVPGRYVATERVHAGRVVYQWQP